MPRKQNLKIDWPKIIEEWKLSGQSQATFCASRGLSSWTLRNKTKTGAKPKDSPMVEIVAQSDIEIVTDRVSVRITFPNQIVVEHKLSGSAGKLENLLRFIKAL